MQSQHAAAFNHDPWAAGYDEDVRSETDPIRTRYADVLAWTVAQAQIEAHHVVIDLGAGTGNTAALVGPVARLFCVDISKKMLALAKAKLAHRDDVEFVQADLLGFFANGAQADQGGPQQVDRVVSTYAVHHLTQLEKATLFQALWQHLRPGGRATFGDLMVADAATHAALVAHFQARSDAATVESLTEEFFWDLEQCERALIDSGFQIAEMRQFSMLSWGIAIVKPVE